MYNSFSEFNIKPKENTFTGKKIETEYVLDVEIVVFDFEIRDSKQKEGTKYLALQIEYEKNKRVVFTSAKTLIDQISQVNKDRFPFKTIIKKNDRRLEFT